MAKPLLCLLLAALCAAFAASALLQATAGHCREQQRRNAQPAEYFTNVVEPQMNEYMQKYSDCDGIGQGGVPATAPTSQPTP